MPGAAAPSADGLAPAWAGFRSGFVLPAAGRSGVTLVTRAGSMGRLAVSSETGSAAGDDAGAGGVATGVGVLSGVAVIVVGWVSLGALPKNRIAKMAPATASAAAKSPPINARDLGRKDGAAVVESRERALESFRSSEAGAEDDAL